MTFDYYNPGNFDARIEQEPYGIATQRQEMNRRPYVTADGNR
jgi:hypothetical protein